MTPEDPQPDTPIKRVERAIRSPYNILGVSVSIAVSAMLLSPWPVAVGIVVELIYLARVEGGLHGRPGGFHGVGRGHTTPIIGSTLFLHATSRES